MDIVLFEAYPVLHIVDEGIKIIDAQFLSKMSAHTVSDTIVRCWCSLYIGRSNQIIVDHGAEYGSVLGNLAE